MTRVPVVVEVSREQLISALRSAGLKIPVDEHVTLAVDNGGEYDSRNEATIGPDGPLRVTWYVEVDTGEIK